jgi:hypothetical protein
MRSYLIAPSPYLSPRQTRMDTGNVDKETRYVNCVRVHGKFSARRDIRVYTYTAEGGVVASLSPGHDGHGIRHA